MKQTLLAVLVALSTFFAAAQDTPATVTKTFADVADTQVRKDKTTDWGASAQLEMNSGANIYILMGFDYAIPEGMKVQSAKLHFVTYKKNGSEPDINLYAYGNDFVENTTYAVEEQYLTDAINDGNKVCEPFALIGHGSQNMAQVTGDWQNLDRWQNSIDITGYMKTVPGSTKRVNFVFVKNVSNRINSKEAADDANLPDWVNALEDKSVLKPYLEVVFVKDSDTVVCNVLPVADTWIRQNNKDNHSGDAKMEIKSVEGGNFYGLMEYRLPDEVLNTKEYEITSVSLRLFHPMINGKRDMRIYSYPTGLAENSIFSDVETVVADVLSGTPIAEYACNGGSGGCDKTTDSKLLTAEAWTNRIDFTEYVKSIVNPETRADIPTSMAFLISKADQENQAIRISTKEAKDIVNTKVTPNVTFAAEDLMPYMTFTLAKRNTTVGIENITVEDANAPVEYYNLSGMKVSGDSMAPGIYVRRQGTKTTKVLVK